MTDCRLMFTRKCPPSGCVELTCARLEDDDESRWATDPESITAQLAADPGDEWEQAQADWEEAE